MEDHSHPSGHRLAGRFSAQFSLDESAIRRPLPPFSPGIGITQVGAAPPTRRRVLAAWNECRARTSRRWIWPNNRPGRPVGRPGSFVKRGDQLRELIGQVNRGVVTVAPACPTNRGWVYPPCSAGEGQEDDRGRVVAAILRGPYRIDYQP